MRKLLLLLLPCLIQAQINNTCYDKGEYNKIGEKSHSIDYLFLDFKNWSDFIKLPKEDSKIEQEAFIAYYNNNKLEFSTCIGLSLSGGAAWFKPQKHISINFSKKKFNSEKINYKLFDNRDYKNLKDLSLRNHGNPFFNTFFNDPLCNAIINQHTDLEYSSFQPVILYINNQYQGLYNIREKKNKDFISTLYDIDEDEIEIIEPRNGISNNNNKEWDSLMIFIQSNNLNLDSNYNYVAKNIDIGNFIDYNISKIYLVAIDWPYKNVKIWKSKRNGKWRWIFYDCDSCLRDYNFNQLEHITGKNQRTNNDDRDLIEATIILRNLIQNDSFKKQFISRYQDLLNTAFLVENTHKLVDSCKMLIQNEVANHIDYWREPFLEKYGENSANVINSVDDWEENINKLINFLDKRNLIARDNLSKKFGLGESTDIEIGVNNFLFGKINLNTIEITQKNHAGLYFKKIPIKLTAIPEKGYEFKYWEGLSNSTKQEIIILPNDNHKKIVAIFQKK